MKTVDLDKLTDGLSRTWAGYLRDWDRSLRAGNYPATTGTTTCSPPPGSPPTARAE